MTKKPTAAQIRARLANPGERSKLPARYLSPTQRKQRELNARLNAPVTPGSSLTNRDLAHQAANAVTVKYGPAEQQANSAIAAGRQTEQDAAGWYDQYQKSLQANAAAINANGQAQNAQLTGLTQAVGAPTAPGGVATPDDANAALVRQKLAASYGALGQQAATIANNYASGLANVVAPGQKLTGLLDLRKQTQSRADALAALKSDEGDYNAQTRGALLKGEQDSVIAQEAITQKTAAQLQDERDKAGSSGAKYGYTPSEWVALSPSQRTSIVARNKAKPAAPGTSAMASTAASHGYSLSEWQAMSADQRRKIIAGDKTKPAKAAKPNNGQGWASGQQQGTAQDDIGKALSYANQFKAKGLSRADVGKALLAGRKSQQIYDVVKQDGKPDKRVPELNADGSPKTSREVPSFDALWASVALDMAYDGHVSKNNVKRLHARGIRIDALGYPTRATA